MENKYTHSLLVILIIIATSSYFGWGIVMQSNYVNTKLHTSDQSAYMNYAKKMAKSDYEYIGTRARMPVYPFLLSLFFDKQMSDNDFFELGKRLSVFISLIVLLAFFLIMQSYIRNFDAVTLLLVAMFTVFSFKAPYVKAEILFYGLFFVLFHLLTELIRKPGVWIGVICAITASITHLTKGSALPIMMLSIVSLFLLTATTINSTLRERDTSNRAHNWKQIMMPVASALILIVVFLAVISPYLINSKRIYSGYFYNVNSTFYMWCDSWDEAKIIKARGDRDGWPKIPEEDIPSMKKYCSDHSAKQVMDRITTSLSIMWNANWKSYGYMQFCFIYFFFSLIIAIQNKQKIKTVLLNNSTNRILLFFVVSLFSSYLILYIWFQPMIGNGNRLILSLFLPFLYIMGRFNNFCQKQQISISICKKEIQASSLSLMILFMLTIYLVYFFPYRIFVMYGGR